MNIVRVIKLRMKLFVSCTQEAINADKILVGKPQVKNHTGDTGNGQKTILQWTLEKQVVKM
jgi:hypothetical protein